MSSNSLGFLGEISLTRDTPQKLQCVPTTDNRSPGTDMRDGPGQIRARSGPGQDHISTKSGSGQGQSQFQSQMICRRLYGMYCYLHVGDWIQSRGFEPPGLLLVFPEVRLASNQD